MDPAVKQAGGGREAGVTLIELLIVLAVLATVAVAGTLAVGRADLGTRSDQQRFEAQFAAARSLAVHSGRARGLALDPAGLSLAAFDGARWQVSDRVLRFDRRVAFFPDVAFVPPGTPEIVFLPDGRATAFRLQLGGPDGALCTSDGWSALTCG